MTARLIFPQYGARALHCAGAWGNLIAQLLKDFEAGRMDRRQLIRSLAMAATASAAMFRGGSATR